MASYKIEWKQSARKELKKLQKKTISRILHTIETLPDNPYPPPRANPYPQIEGRLGMVALEKALGVSL